MLTKWVQGAVPPALPVRQVYGLLFDHLFRVLVQNDRGRYNLPGGKPEGTETWIETLARECMEESQVDFIDPIFLGYVEVQDSANGIGNYAQLRCIARISTIHPQAADISTGLTYGRELVPAAEVAKVLDWGVHGSEQLKAATKLARERYRFDRISRQRNSV